MWYSMGQSDKNGTVLGLNIFTTKVFFELLQNSWPLRLTTKVGDITTKVGTSVTTKTGDGYYKTSDLLQKLSILLQNWWRTTTVVITTKVVATTPSYVG